LIKRRIIFINVGDNNKIMIITVFGGSEPSEETNECAYRLGKLIASKGHTLKNGGTSGTMESSAKGAREKNGTVIGAVVTGSDIGSLGHHNKYITEKITFSSYSKRTREMFNTDHIIVLEGGIGTLEELFTAWIDSLVHTKKKITVLGEKNKKLLNFLKEEEMIKEEYFKYIHFVETITDIPFLK